MPPDQRFQEYHQTSGHESRGYIIDADRSNELEESDDIGLGIEHLNISEQRASPHENLDGQHRFHYLTQGINESPIGHDKTYALPTDAPSSELSYNTTYSPPSTSDSHLHSDFLSDCFSHPQEETVQPVLSRQLPLSFTETLTSTSEDGQMLLYREKMRQEFMLDQDEDTLVSEIVGLRVVPVHGSGIWSYREHISTNSEQVKRSLWVKHGSHDAWLASARARTTYYSSAEMMKPPLRWVLVERDEGQNIPENAIQTGSEPAGKLYSARAWWHGGVLLGKAGCHLPYGGATVSYHSIEYSLPTFEVLVGDSSRARWIGVSRNATMSPSTRGHTDVERNYINGNTSSHRHDITSVLPFFIPVEGGREVDGSPLFITQALYEDGWHPGKAGLDEDHCCIGYCGGEAWVRSFNVLAYHNLESGDL